jgi:hypothetical protein
MDKEKAKLALDYSFYEVVFRLGTRKNSRNVRTLFNLLFLVAGNNEEWRTKPLESTEQDALRGVLDIVPKRYILWALELRDATNATLLIRCLRTLTDPALLSDHAFPRLRMTVTDWKDYFSMLDTHRYTVFDGY